MNRRPPRRHHFVPQAYLQSWSPDGHSVWVHRLLVPDEAFPRWEFKTIRGVAWHEHLYSLIDQRGENATFEEWLNREIETPAARALDKVGADRPLSRSEMRCLLRYVAALDLRTPTGYVESLQRWHRELPRTLDESLSRAVETYEAKGGNVGPVTRSDDDDLAGMLPLRVMIEEDASGKPGVRAEITVGRALWQFSMTRALTHTFNALLAHSWSIMTPPSSTNWFTSDHPVVRLNFYPDRTYDFRGGWGRPGTEIFVPLSPRHLLFTHVGKRLPERFVMKPDHTAMIQRFIAERAGRMIFACSNGSRPTWFRQRIIDRARYWGEAQAWQRGHQEHGEAERRLL